MQAALLKALSTELSVDISIPKGLLHSIKMEILTISFHVAVVKYSTLLTLLIGRGTWFDIRLSDLSNTTVPGA